MRDSLLGGTRWLVRGLEGLNWLAGAGFAIVFLLSFWADGPLMVQLAGKYGARAGVIVVGLRVLLATGLLAVGVAVFFLRALREILDSVEAGDPFVAENGARLRRMGFALLAYQLGDLALGAIDHWLARLGAEVAPWTPAFGGWLAVLLLFVLARIFSVGAAMRDDLEGTI